MKFKSAAYGINFILSVFMASLIFVMGLGLLLSNAFSDTIPPPKRIWMGWIFLAYATFRGIRVWLMMKKIKKHEAQE